MVATKRELKKKHFTKPKCRPIANHNQLLVICKKNINLLQEMCESNKEKDAINNQTLKELLSYMEKDITMIELEWKENYDQMDYYKQLAKSLMKKEHKFVKIELKWKEKYDQMHYQKQVAESKLSAQIGQAFNNYKEYQETKKELENARKQLKEKEKEVEFLLQCQFN